MAELIRIRAALVVVAGALALAAPAAAAGVAGGTSGPVDAGGAGTGGAPPSGIPAPSGGPTAAHAPVVVSDRCLGGCGSDGRSVHVGGRLALRGQHLLRGMVVLFAVKRGGAPGVSSPLRVSSSGLVVTVPEGAHTGRIVVGAAGGPRSRPFGPIQILARRHSPGSPGGNVPPPTGTAFDGKGMWIWYLSQSEGGDLTKVIARAHSAGVTTLFIKSSDGSSNYWSQFTSALITQLHAAGLHVCAWQYVYGTRPDGEAALGARAAKAGADCLVIDAESEYEGNYSAAQTYITDLRAAVGPSYPVGLASFPYVDYHPTLPYSVFLGPGGAQFNVPQMYWYDIGTSVDTVFSHTYTENRIYGRPIMPLGQTYGGVPSAQIYRFRGIASLYGASGLSFWDWQETNSNGWASVSQSLTPPSGVTVSTDVPGRSQGSSGDQVLWLQEHLAAAEPTTPTTGRFDAATASALRAFQSSHGLTATGSTNAATWQAVLALTPVAVNWTAH